MPAGGRVALLLTTLLAATLAAGCTTQESTRAACTLEQRQMPPRDPAAAASDDKVLLEVTRDHGTVALKRVNATVGPDDSVLDVLMRHAEVETAYGGGFVVAIDGLRSGGPDAQTDWFYEVDGASPMIGAADYDVASGDHIHWDYRAWGPTAAPGHFNSFPWNDAASSDGTDSWPEGPAVVVATASEAPWDLLPWADATDGTLTACGRTFDAPWTLQARADPLGSQRVLLVGDDAAHDEPAVGHAWIHHDGTTYEVELP